VRCTDKDRKSKQKLPEEKQQLVLAALLADPTEIKDWKAEKH